MEKTQLKREIIETKDGSKTFYIPDLDENYHSLNGAIQESMHVFINTGLEQLRHLTKINVFEVGFGTGLNALLTLQLKEHQEIYYHSIEKYPLKEEEIQLLNYTSFSDELHCYEDAFMRMHSCQWDTNENIATKFTLFKEYVTLSNFEAKQKFNLIYFDAFAPDIQPDLWTKDVFLQMYNLLERNGLLVTYCAKGQVRRNMQDVGFKVERLPGPPGKREMLRATKY